MRAAGDGGGDRFVGEAVARGDEEAHDAALGMQCCIGDERLRRLAQDAHGKRIGKHGAAFHQLMHGAMRSRAARGEAGLARLHARQSSRFPVTEIGRSWARGDSASPRRHGDTKVLEDYLRRRR